MRTARRYLAREIYRSCAVVLLALLGLFTFFALIDDLDSVGGKFTLFIVVYLQTLEIPTRLYDLLPIGLLIGAILALASLAQRNELVIFRVSGISSLRLLRMLWVITIPIMIGATLLSEYITPWAEIKSNEANLTLRGRAGGDRLKSGYWFKEPLPDGGTRIINIAELKGDNEVAGVTLYEFKKNLTLSALTTAVRGLYTRKGLLLKEVTETGISDTAVSTLANAQPPTQPPSSVTKIPERLITTTLTPERLIARVLTPERMSIVTLLDYVDYLSNNQLQYDRQAVALWRKLAYPFTLLVMMTIAAPIGLMQTRRGGVGAKVFIGILLGVGFFMLNQLVLNVGMLGKWPAWLTALGPSIVTLPLALMALLYMEYRHKLTHALQQFWPWKKALV